MGLRGPVTSALRVLAPPPTCRALCRSARPPRARCTRCCSPTATPWARTSWTRSWPCSAAPPGECGPCPSGRSRARHSERGPPFLSPRSLPRTLGGNRTDEAPGGLGPWLPEGTGRLGGARPTGRSSGSPRTPGSRLGASWGPRGRFSEGNDFSFKYTFFVSKEKG